MAAASHLASDLSITLGARRPRLVLDPWLCLDGAGPVLIQRLQALAELWIVREMWHILDDSHYFALYPNALVSTEGGKHALRDYRALFANPEDAPNADPRSSQLGQTQESGSDARALELRRTLQFWDQIRISSDLSGLRLFWIGDGLAESLLPDGSPTWIHPLHERLARWLDTKLEPKSPLACAQRDALALSLCLGGVPVLSLRDRAGEAFSLTSWLSATNMSCAAIPDGDRFAALERELWTSILVRANCTPLMWDGLHLSLVHVHAALPPNAQHEGPAQVESSDELVELCPDHVEQARAYWFAL
jgi:hypothetical protein